MGIQGFEEGSTLGLKISRGLKEIGEKGPLIRRWHSRDETLPTYESAPDTGFSTLFLMYRDDRCDDLSRIDLVISLLPSLTDYIEY